MDVKQDVNLIGQKIRSWALFFKYGRKAGCQFDWTKDKKI